MKKFLLMVSIVGITASIYGQYVEDALRFSQNFPSLTARSMAMGSAFTSLGGDLSSVYLNPAGLGIYRKSEVIFSPGLGYSSIKSKYQGQSNQDYKYQFILGNFGYVGTYNTNKDKGLVSASYAVGYNRLNNFNSNTYIRGENPSNSLADYFMQNAVGIDPEYLEPFYERLAFDAYVIDTVPGTNYDYQTPVLLPVAQRKTITTKGGTGEWSLAVGLNFNNMFYMGMGLGIQQLRYDQTTVHSEYDDRNLNDFNNFHFTEDLNVAGTGFNFRMGVMLRLFEVMRIGASLQLPTYYRMNEEYYNTLRSEFDDGSIYMVRPTDSDGNLLQTGSFEYKLNTPLKLQGGASLQIGKSGIIAADLEFIDYSNMRLREADSYSDFSGPNREIEDIYRSVVNFKLGGELRLNNLFIRAGGAYYPSPYVKGELNEDSSNSEFTAGIGYRDRSFFFDLGFSGLMHAQKYNLYFDNVANLDQFKYRLLATIGFRF
jgi:hypothetical protein